MAPERVQSEEEFKTASIPDRMTAMKACQKAGYSIGLHFDPVIHHTGWEKNYKKLVDQIFASINKKKISWVSIGALRFPANQVSLMRTRFPSNRKIFNNLISGQGRVMQYPDRLRDAIYRRMRDYLHPYIPEDKIYISMEAELVTKESS
jgi:spore photoproduct lyase